jgi:hypothetical protein
MARLLIVGALALTIFHEGFAAYSALNMNTKLETSPLYYLSK